MIKYIVFFFLFGCGSAQPLFVVTQPKSGTSYLSAELRRYFGNKLGHMELGYSPSEVQIKQLSGLYAHQDIPILDHFYFKKSHIDMIHEMGNRVLFVPRDPRQAVVSMAIHRVVYKRSHNIDISRDPDGYAAEICNYLQGAFKDLFEARINQLNLWMESKKEHPETVCILTFEELKDNRNRFFRRLFNHFGLSVDLSRIRAPRLGKDRVRNSSKREWEKYLDDDLKAYANEALSDDMLQFYGWER